MGNIGNLIKETRNKKALSQEELAELANVNLRTIQRIENNESNPRNKTISLIFDALELNWTDIETTKEQPNKNYLILATILCVIIIISSFSGWFSFVATNGSTALRGQTLTTTGWEGSLSIGFFKLYNWLISLCGLSIGTLVLLMLLDIVKTRFAFLVGQIIIITLYLIFYIFLSLDIESLSLKHGLFLMIASTIGLILLLRRIKKTT
ncbi:helix-turn-helix transcriptional regulator [Seonamhaeicola aphaedonensis]|uniref:Helix-turn-helix protein n=1 Tax=Seonamhaeicola aphaedonensis TaxID=1461338 RepID=A0A3D9HJE3_9FLAO|nr:helix-turn-helix transcriptional regulator [Seonamhaeicola aphaedonensis]RED49564.1 helix-turn-helix protein [Seonamhaeicola aphaedonensis]